MLPVAELAPMFRPIGGVLQPGEIDLETLSKADRAQRVEALHAAEDTANEILRTRQDTPSERSRYSVVGMGAP